MNAEQTFDRPASGDKAPEAHDPRLHVSAFVDGELADADVERVIDALLASDDLADFWADAHRAGDWMRSEEVVGVGDGGVFLTNFSARLASEPAIVAPKRGRSGARLRSRRFWIRTGLPGASVAAALVVVAWVASPLGGSDDKSSAVPSVAIIQAPHLEEAAIRPTEFKTIDQDRLADYLAAHRDVTPFAYRGAASARTASFTATPVDASSKR